MTDAWQAKLTALRADAVFDDQVTAIHAHINAISKPIPCGMTGNVVLCTPSLPPKPCGRGVQNNERKRQYVLAHIEALRKYRTLC
jgi:hypothetical protein